MLAASRSRGRGGASALRFGAAAAVAFVTASLLCPTVLGGATGPPNILLLLTDGACAAAARG
jgi:hypothetical protein